VRIALDVSMLGREGGIPAYAEQLVGALSRLGGHELVLWSASPKTHAHIRTLAPAGARIVEAGPGERALARLGLFLGASPLPIERLVGPVDVFHGLNYLLPSHRGRPARVVTVHDLSVLRHPGWHPTSRAWLYRLPLRRTLSGAHHIIADSEVIRGEVIERIGVSPERVTAVPLAPSPDFSPQSLDALRPVLGRHRFMPGEYLLFVGALEPRKNVGRLLDALDLLRQRAADVPPLAIVGPPGWRNEEIHARVMSSATHVRLLGYLPQRDVVALMAGAAVFTLPSLYEGFGIPVLEAMACGTPVLTSRSGALAEIAGDAALLVDPGDVEEIAAGVEKVLGDSQLRADLSRRGMARAAQFSWERTARETVQVYERVLAAN
jgi:alpha-1,3-rhamnosyl/mannosyltransferase